MQLDGHATNQDINTLIDELCDSTDTSYPVAKKVLHINAGYETIIGRILTADGIWEWDDTNYTTFPTATTTLVDGQRDYSFEDGFLKVIGVSVLDNDGNYQKLSLLDENNLPDRIDLDEYEETSGMPKEYALKGRSVLLLPAPATANVTLAAGLKVYYQRIPSTFTTTDTTKTPGFAPIYHYILAYMAAIPYCMKYHPERVKSYQAEVDKIVGNDTRGIKGEIVKFYSKRSKEHRSIITTRRINYI